MAGYVFICYSHQDDSAVLADVAWLREAGVECWYDDLIPGGTEWSDELARRILECETFLYFLSPDSAASEHCRQERNYAQSHGKRIIAIELKPTTLSPGLEMSLTNRQIVVRHALDPAEYRLRLTEAIGGDMNAIMVSAKREPIVPHLALLFAAAAALLLMIVWWYRPDHNPVPASKPVVDIAEKILQAPPRCPPGDQPRIAVLPFRDLSDADAQFQTAGIREDVHHQLSKIGAVLLKALESVDQAAVSATVADDLDVCYLVAGSVQASGDTLRIRIRLTEAVTGHDIWSERYDRALELGKLFEIQEDIATMVAAALEVQFNATSGPPTSSPDAYRAFVAARGPLERWDIHSLEDAERNLRRAVELDPLYADAWAALSFANSGIEELMPGLSREERDARLVTAERYARRALNLDEGWLGYYALGNVYRRRYDSTGSVESYRRASALNPNHAGVRRNLAVALRGLGRTFEARDEFREAYARNPLSYDGNVAGAWAAILDADREKARAHIEQALAFSDYAPSTLTFVALLHTQNNDRLAALRTIDQLFAQAPNDLNGMYVLLEELYWIGDIDVQHRWAEQFQTLRGPDDSEALFFRAQNLRSRFLQLIHDGDLASVEPVIAEYQVLVEHWRTLAPDDRNLRSHLHAVDSALGSLRQAQNKTAEALRYRRLAMATLMPLLNRNPDELVLHSFWDAFLFLSAGAQADSVEETALADGLYRKVIDYYAGQPPGFTIFSETVSAIAHAGSGDLHRAIEHLKRANELGQPVLPLLISFDVIRDHFGIFHEINRHPEFRAIVARAETREEEVRRLARSQFPRLFGDSLQGQPGTEL